MHFSLDQTVTDPEFGAIVGCDHSTVQQWRSKGRLPTPLVLGPGLHAMYFRLREQAALRLGSGDSKLDLMHERAALAKAQREGVELKNQVLRGQYAEIALLERVLAASAGAVVEKLDFLPAKLRMTFPELPAAVLDQVAAFLATTRNDWARSMASLVAEQVLQPEEEDDEPELPLDEGSTDVAA